MIHEGTGSVKGKYWLVRGDTGSVWGGTGWYLVRRGQYWLIYDGTGSVPGVALGCQASVIIYQNTRVYSDNRHKRECSAVDCAAKCHLY